MQMRHWLALSLLSSLSLPASAEEDWSLCPAPNQYTPPTLDSGLPQGAMQGSADRLESQGENRVILDGNVVLETHTERVIADHADFNRTTGDMQLTGNVQMQTPEMHMSADSGSYSQTGGIGNFEGAQYQLRNPRANGQANNISRPSTDVTILDKAVYTTCNVPQPEWAIHAGQLKMDQGEGIGTARHLRLHVLDTPVFYWPYASFPINDKRKSGLLFPSFGNSSDNGFEFSQPIYWNIHPQADATIIPRYLSKRGTQAQTEWRYLNRIGDYKLDAEYLDDSRFNDERWLVGFTHTGNLGHNWTSSIATRRVSDGLYLDDLSSNLGIGKPQHLLSTGSLNYSGEIWHHRIGADQYQTLDQNIALSSRPHHREPFIYSNANAQWRDLDLEFKGSLINYTHDNNVNGHRIDLYPSISKTFGTAGWYVKPKVGVRHTQYELNDLTTTTDESPSRTTAIASVDSGLIFERSLNNNRLQTLEPRLYALYVPVEEQINLPLFDTSTYTFSYAQLFRENRFTGADRQGDAKQVSLGLTTRVLDENNGEELLSASIGQAFYADDRQVTLNETTVDTRKSSDIAANGQIKLAKRWSASTSLQYNPELNQVERRTYRLRYKASGDQIVNAGYRYTRDNLKQAELSGVWPFGPKWTAVGRWLYDLENNQSLETFAGFGYQSCCWAVSLVGRRQLENNEYDNEIMLQITLKGLASIGDDNDTLLKRGILGYDD